MADDPKDWWRGAVMYQIYPRSFLDTTGSGTGDLKGIIDKLDYVASLGVEGIWISPFFRSPMKDFGYDISDYRSVDPMFGDLDDFKALLRKAHDLGLKIIVDMVLSHTSREHPWFIESKMDQINPKADWYVWADPKIDGSPPNNWVSIFGGSAWHFDVLRGQYYLHNFLTDQPDLNYHNPEVVEAVLGECRFWLDLGVDGLRLDVINFCTHDKELLDNPHRDQHGAASQLDFPDVYSMQYHVYDKSRPENFNFLRKLRALLDEYPGTMSLAEIGDDDSVKVSAAYTASDDLLHTAYSFSFMMNKGRLPDANFFRKHIEEQASYPGDSWPSWAFSNHDVVRAASRWSGTDFDHDPRLSRLLMALLCSLRGTAFIYQGEELGLPEVEIAYADIQDPWGRYLYPKWQGRDGERTPMPWDAEQKNLGFSKADDTWLPASETHRDLAVSVQEERSESQLHFTRSLLAWRKTVPALAKGDITFIDGLPADVLAFYRSLGDQRVLCVFNLSAYEMKVSCEALGLVPEAAEIAFDQSVVNVEGEGYVLPAYGFVFLK